MAHSELRPAPYTVSDFLSWKRAGTLRLNPDFQRRPVWKKLAKSYFIDTILRRLPTPLLFIRELPADLNTLQKKREVVDGQQRLRTLLSFIDPSVLEDYDPSHDDFTIAHAHDPKLAGYRFVDLSPKQKQRILDYPFGVHTFDSKTGDREVLQIFARMNATGVRLNDQELRNAEFHGEFKSSAYELAYEQLPRWKEWRIFTAHDIARMSEVELTSELMILMLGGISEKAPKVINRAYRDYDESFPGQSEISRRFQHAFDLIEETFATDGIEFFSSRTLFYCLFAALYDLQYGFGSSLKRTRPVRLSSAAVRHIRAAGSKINREKAPKAVMDATTRRTTHIRERKTIVNYLLG